MEYSKMPLMKTGLLLCPGFYIFILPLLVTIGHKGSGVQNIGITIIIIICEIVIIHTAKQMKLQNYIVF